MADPITAIHVPTKAVMLMQRSLLDIAGSGPIDCVELTNELENLGATLEVIGGLVAENGPFNIQHDLRKQLESAISSATLPFLHMQKLRDIYLDKLGPLSSESKRTEVLKLLNEIRSDNLRLGLLLNVAQNVRVSFIYWFGLALI